MSEEIFEYTMEFSPLKKISQMLLKQMGIDIIDFQWNGTEFKFRIAADLTPNQMKQLDALLSQFLPLFKLSKVKRRIRIVDDPATYIVDGKKERKGSVKKREVVEEVCVEY